MKDNYEMQREREQMVESQLAGRDIRDKRVLLAMSQVPRHRFVPPEHRQMAYADGPLPIGSGQTISQPYIVALMTQLLRLKGDERVLEVGTGSGYQAAVLSVLAEEVHTIERHPELAKKASVVFDDLGIENVHVHVGDGSQGYPPAAPYQAMLVTAAAPETPQVLLEQLDEHGRLVIPVGSRLGQYLQTWTRQAGEYEKQVHVPVAFVPLRGEFGWQDDPWGGE